MEGGAIAAIVIVLVLVLVGAGVGIYFATRPADAAADDTDTGSGDGTKKLYYFYQGKDAGGNDIIPPSPYTAASVSDLLKKCNATPGCVAANTNGWIKSATVNFGVEGSFPGPTQGLYVLSSAAGSLGTPTSQISERFRGNRIY